MIPSQVASAVRGAVASVLHDTPALRERPELQREISERMLGVSMAAAQMLAEDRRITQDLERTREPAEPMAQAQSAATMQSGRAVEQAAGTVEGLKDAIDFPSFVTNLITGVFQSIQTSNIQQLESFSELMGAVSGSVEDFSSQIGRGRAAQWAVDRFGVFRLEIADEELEMVLRDDADMPDTETLRRVLDASQEEVDSIDDSELGETLIPLVQRKLGRDRQSMLATMIMMGLQRVVVDDGALHASMELQVDARSIAERTQAEQFDTRVETEASGNFGLGAWGASAKMSASVGYVKSDEQYSREDIAARAGLRSSVDLRFRTLPLDVRRLADDRELQTVQSRSLNPDAPGGFQSLLSNPPDRVTQRPDLPEPAGPGSLLNRDAGTQDEARRNFEAAQRREREREQREGAEESSGRREEQSGGEGAEEAQAPAERAEPTADESAAAERPREGAEPPARASEGGEGGEGGEGEGSDAPAGEGQALSRGLSLGAANDLEDVASPRSRVSAGQWGAPRQAASASNLAPARR